MRNCVDWGYSQEKKAFSAKRRMKPRMAKMIIFMIQLYQFRYERTSIHKRQKEHMKIIQIDLERHVRALGIALVLLFAAALFGLSALSAHAADEDHDLEYAGWVPWFQDEDGAERAEDHLDELDTVHPFVYEVDADGSLVAKSDMDDEHWEDLFEAAEDEDVEVIPTVAWFDGANIDRILGDRELREEHIEAIVDMVEDNDFDGVDIDYESKLAATKDDFSDFLEELKDELDDAILTCTIEARTPPSSVYRDVPSNIERANDYEEIGEHCDRVEIMAYDQQRIDWRLNDSKSGQPYIPVADVDWVEKVVEETIEDIPEDKIMLGVPTYGRHWTLTVAPDWYKEYDNLGAVNLPDAEAIAKENDIEPGRNRAGELSFTYFPEDSIFKILEVLPVPDDTPEWNKAAAQALLFATHTGMEVPVNVVWYSDAEAIEDKIDLAREYALRGIALFKVDGEEDEDVWGLMD